MTEREKNLLLKITWWLLVFWIAFFVLCVGLARAQTFDGPAELPRTVPASVAVSMNAPISVAAGGNLQAVINSAICGDTIQYDPAGIWTTVTFMLPSLACDAQHWITIDLRGGKIVLAGSSGTVTGGIFVRLANGQITRIGGTGVVYNMIAPRAGAHDLIYDNLDVEGTPTDETVRGFEISNVPRVAIINTKVREMHCLAYTGTCTDSQAVNFGLDTVDQGGNYLFDHDDFEASGENILGGGDAANFVPCDITITNTRLAKPDSWNPNEPSFAGKQWIVKNLFELKNGCRVLFANNQVSGTWGGYTQTGFAILLTPKNPGSTCPNCAVTDVTIRTNTVTKTAQAMQLGCAPSDTGGWPADCGRWSIHDNSFSKLQYPTCYKCGQWLVQISSNGGGPSGSPVLHDVSVNLNTFDLDAWYKSTGCPSCGHGFLLVGGPPTGMPNIQFTNNVTFSGNYPMYSTGGGPAVNCAISGTSDYAALLNACWTGKSAFIGNVILFTGAPAKVGLANWPAGNHIVTAGQGVNGN